MKLHAFLILLLLSTSVSAQKQKQKQKQDTIPHAITACIEKEYPDAKLKSWQKSNTGYEAALKIEGQDALLKINNNGDWVETIIEMSETDMPGRIPNYLESNYPGSKIVSSIYKETKDNGAFYFIQIKKPKSTMDVDVELFFDASGGFQTKTEFHPIDEALSTSVVQEAERKAKKEKEDAEYKAKREALLKMDRTVAEADLPAKMKENFKKKFPKAVISKWDTLDNIYTAYFIDNEMQCTSDFSPEGDWLATVETLLPGPIYRPVDQYLEENFPAFKIKLAQRITRRDRNNTYYLEIHEKARKGQIPPVTKLVFDKNGKFVSKEDPPVVLAAPEPTQEEPVVSKEEDDQFESKLTREDGSGKNKDQDLKAEKVTGKELPSKITNYVEATYPEYKVKEAFFSEYDDLGPAYKVIIKREGLNQPSSDLYFSVAGQLLREDNPPPKKEVVQQVTKSVVKEEEKVEEEKVEKEKPVQEEEVTEQEEGEPGEVDAAEIPALVKKNFSRRFPKAEETVWKSDENKYFAEFLLNDVNTTIEFSADGVIQVTKTEMDPKNIFGPVQRYLDTKYPSYKVRYAEKVVRKDRKDYYYLEIYSKKRNANPPELQLYFDKNGKLIEK